MTTKIAQSFSYLFHPLFIPILGLCILMYLPSTPTSFLVEESIFHSPSMIKYIVLFLFGIFGVLAPGFSLILFKYNDTISSYHLEIQEERKVPIFMMSIYMLLLFGFLAYQLPSSILPKIVPAIALGAGIGVLCAGALNQILKISLHLLGMGMLTGAVYAYYLNQFLFPNWVLPLIFIASGIVAAARLKLGAHTYRELIIGYVVGFIAQVLTVLFY